MTRASSLEVVTLPGLGSLRGDASGAALAFRGLPYARPPIGPLRFAAPEPPDPWTGVRDATRFGSAPPQRSDPLTASLGMLEGCEIGEDCLTLNVFTPSLAPASFAQRAAGERRPSGGRPVLVWIPGGAFVGGTAGIPLYDGSAARRARRRRGGDGDLSRRGARLRAARCGGRRARGGEPRPPGSARRAALGARTHRGVRRRSCARHGVRRIRWRREHPRARRHARCARTVRARDRAECGAARRDPARRGASANARAGRAARPRAARRAARCARFRSSGCSTRSMR